MTMKLIPKILAHVDIAHPDLFEEGYASSGRQPPIRLPYSYPYNWAIPPMHEPAYCGQISNQLASLLESQKQLMVIFKNVAQRIGTLKHTVASLKSQVPAVPEPWKRRNGSPPSSL